MSAPLPSPVAQPRPRGSNFYGTTEHKLLGKNQISIPKPIMRAWRTQEPEGKYLYLVQWPSEPFLRLYTPAGLDDATAEIQSRDDLPREIRHKLAGDIAARAHEVEPDSQGRFVIPAEWVERLGIQEMVRTEGRLNYARISPIKKDETAQDAKSGALQAEHDQAVRLALDGDHTR